MGLASAWLCLVVVFLVYVGHAKCYYNCDGPDVIKTVPGCPSFQADCAAIGTLMSSVFVNNATLCTEAICYALQSSGGCNCWHSGWTASDSQGLFSMSPRWHQNANAESPFGTTWRCPANMSDAWFDPVRNAQCAYVAWKKAGKSWYDWNRYIPGCETNPVAVTGCACPNYQTTTSTSTVAATTTRAASTSTTAASTTASASTKLVASSTTTEASTTAVSTTTEASTAASSTTTIAATQASTSAVESTLSATSAAGVAATTASSTSAAAVTASASLTNSVASGALINGPLPATGGIPPAPTGQLIVVIDIAINTSWSAPPVIIFDGGAISVNGTAYINGTIAQVHVGEQGPETRRVPLVHASEIVGRFATVDVLYDEQRMKSGKCRQYFVGAQDKIGGDLSVLVASREVPCGSDNPQAWVITGVIAGVLGVLLLILGLLFLVRDAALRWVRGLPPNEEDALSLTGNL